MLVNDASIDAKLDQMRLSSSRVYIGGIIRDATKINKSIWKTVKTLNCRYDYGVHIIARQGVGEAMAMYANLSE